MRGRIVVFIPLQFWGKANDLYISFGKVLLFWLCFGVGETNEGLLSQYWPVINNVGLVLHHIFGGDTYS